MITAERIRALLDYDPKSGSLLWRIDKGRSRIGDIAGSRRSDGYIRLKLDQRSYLCHRLIWLLVTGKWPGELDHVNGCPEDNRIENLRECSRSQNLANRSSGRTSKLIPKGVSRRRTRYRARIKVDGHEVYLGTYETETEASSSYKKAALEYYGEYARS